MPALSWNEIRHNAIQFSPNPDAWRDAHYERGEAQSFWNNFFKVFGLRRRTVACSRNPAALSNNFDSALFW